MPRQMHFYSRSAGALRYRACAAPRIWWCIARTGSDRLTPTVRGTFDVHEKYFRLDVVMMDGASFIAKCHNPASALATVGLLSGKAEAAEEASLVHLVRPARRARRAKLLQRHRVYV
jgi:hypothetical protein